MDIDEIRRSNIRELEKEFGATFLAKGAGMSPSQYYNLRDGAKDSKTGRPRGMRKETAWKFEDAAGVPRGYLDIQHNNLNSQSIEKVNQLWPFVSIPKKDFDSLTDRQKGMVEQILQIEVNKHLESNMAVSNRSKTRA